MTSLNHSVLIWLWRDVDHVFGVLHLVVRWEFIVNRVPSLDNDRFLVLLRLRGSIRVDKVFLVVDNVDIAVLPGVLFLEVDVVHVRDFFLSRLEWRNVV